jgi:hypothetical protein
MPMDYSRYPDNCSIFSYSIYQTSAKEGTIPDMK